MEAYESDSMKSEKAGAILLYKKFKCIFKLFRIVEICLGLVFLSWTSSRLPFAVKIFGEYFRQIISVIMSPLFTFLVCNAIVVTLLLKAGSVLVGPSPAAGEIEADLYEGFIESTDECTEFTNAVSSSVSDPEEIFYQDKETIFEERKTSFTTLKTGDFDAPEECEPGIKAGETEFPDVPESKSENDWELKDLRRSQSEKLKMENMAEEEELVLVKSHGKLRRSETEKWRKVANPGEMPEETVYVFDELSNEEFQRTIEAFIAKQIKFHREEKLAIVLSSHA